MSAAARCLVERCGVERQRQENLLGGPPSWQTWRDLTARRRRRKKRTASPPNNRSLTMPEFHRTSLRVLDPAHPASKDSLRICV